MILTQRRIVQKAQQPIWIDARAFAGQTRRQKIFPILRLILRQIHQHRALADLKRVTAHTIVFLYDPPTILNILAPLILWIVEERLGHVRAFRADAAQQERRQRIAPVSR